MCGEVLTHGHSASPHRSIQYNELFLAAEHADVVLHLAVIPVLLTNVQFSGLSFCTLRCKWLMKQTAGLQATTLLQCKNQS